MERELIASNVYLTLLPNDKFKRNRINITMTVPNDRDKATMYALLPDMMERAYEDYPDMQLMSRRLSQMYSANLSISTAVIGTNRIMRFSITGIKNDYCLNGENLLAEMCNLLLGVIFRPCLENGAFKESWLEVEKYKLRERIEGEINEKRTYCINEAKGKFFKDSIGGVKRLGYLEEIDGITAQQLYNCYRYLLENALVDVFVTANETAGIKENIIKAFSYEKNIQAAKNALYLQPVLENPEEYTEIMDTVQGKICLVYTLTRAINADERYQMLVASGIFGGSASSRLFKNVREKQSLCYYCAASYNGFGQYMVVDSGVEHQNAQKTIDAIQKELADMINGEITKKEIAEIKLNIKNSLKGSYDSIYGLESWYLNEYLRDSRLTPEEVMKKVDRVTEQQIKDVLRLLNLNVIYKMTK